MIYFIYLLFFLGGAVFTLFIVDYLHSQTVEDLQDELFNAHQRNHQLKLRLEICIRQRDLLEGDN